MSAARNLYLVPPLVKVVEQKPEPAKTNETDTWLGSKMKTKKKTKTIPNKRFEKALGEVKERLATGDWEKATAIHFVAVYSVMHATTYGIESPDLSPKERLQAAGLASRVLKDVFGGDPVELARYVSWAWAREQRTEAWRRENHRDGGRLEWGRLFGKKMLGDYQMSLVRRGEG